jgi:hypothetical protein
MFCPYGHEQEIRNGLKVCKVCDRERSRERYRRVHNVPPEKWEGPRLSDRVGRIYPRKGRGGR